jgi:hypothetical protein
MTFIFFIGTGTDKSTIVNEIFGETGVSFRPGTIQTFTLLRFFLLKRFTVNKSRGLAARKQHIYCQYEELTGTRFRCQVREVIRQQGMKKEKSEISRIFLEGRKKLQ